MKHIHAHSHLHDHLHAHAHLHANSRTLKDIAIGKSGRVLFVGGDKVLRRRLLDMGITPRTVITVKKVAPLGDPVEITVRGYALTLRKTDATLIEVE